MFVSQRHFEFRIRIATRQGYVNVVDGGRLRRPEICRAWNGIFASNAGYALQVIRCLQVIGALFIVPIVFAIEGHQDIDVHILFYPLNFKY